MIFCNVDHIKIEELQDLSRQGGASFLLGGAFLFLAMAELESQNLKAAAASLRDAISRFDKATTALDRLANLITEKYSWLSEELRKIDAAEAASSVYLPLDKELTTEIIQGRLDRVIASCAVMGRNLSARLRVVADRAEQAPDTLKFDFRLAHEVLSLWRLTLEHGQQISGICMLFNLAGTR
jgi:hypothetical protein